LTATACEIVVILSRLSLRQSINQSINHAAGDAPYVNLKKRIAGADTVYD